MSTILQGIIIGSKTWSSIGPGRYTCVASLDGLRDEVRITPGRIIVPKSGSKYRQFAVTSSKDYEFPDDPNGTLQSLIITTTIRAGLSITETSINDELNLHSLFLDGGRLAMVARGAQ